MNVTTVYIGMFKDYKRLFTIPLRTYKPLTEISGQATEQNVFLLDQFTIANDKVLVIEIFEKNGGRHQVLQVENSNLINARLVNDMHLKF